MTETVAVSRGQQLEAAVEHLPAWYFAAQKQQPSSSRVHGAATVDVIHATLKSVCETDDKPQPLDEDDVAHDPSSNATICCLDDELELPNDLSLLTESHVVPLDQPQVPHPIRDEEVGASSPTSSPHDRSSSSSSSSSATDLVVSGFSMRGREKRVMYHIDVVAHDAPLQTYTICRSYSDFKELYVHIRDMLETRQVYYHTRAGARLTRGVVTPVLPDAFVPTQEDKLERAVLACTLPPLPHAGLLTYWKRHDRAHLQARCDRFQELLRTVQRIAFLRDSFAMRKFLSVAPCAIRDRGSSYVSLCEYGVPTLNPEDEQRERKRRAQEYRRNSTASNQSTRIVE